MRYWNEQCRANPHVKGAEEQSHTDCRLLARKSGVIAGTHVPSFLIVEPFAQLSAGLFFPPTYFLFV